MSVQLIKFLTMFKPDIIFSIVEIILLILIVKRLEEIYKSR